jgi:triacylglycerol lipase
MLAKLLRWTLLVVAGAGALLMAWLFTPTIGLVTSLLLGALGAPLLFIVATNVLSFRLSRNPKEPAHLWWRAMGGELRASIQIFLLRQPWTLSAPVIQPSNGARARLPVVLVHGYCCNHRIWDDLTVRLTANGHHVLAVNLEPLFGSIENYVPVLEAAVQSLLLQTGQSRVALVGHSMGGLAIRAWMRSCGVHRVARVLTLGTPHLGTRFAKGSQTINGAQMAWASPWMTQLAQGESQHIRDLIRIAITPQDNIVWPQRAQTLTGIHPVVFSGIGHLQMCTHEPVLQWVLDELSGFSPE